MAKTLESGIVNRNAKAAELATKYDAIQKEIIDFMKEDENVSKGGWNGSPYSYLQYVLTGWAVKALRPQVTGEN
jgi:hypothetical protein